MSVVKRLLNDVKIPKFYKIEQKFPDIYVKDIVAEIDKQTQRVISKVKNGSRIGLTVGSRGINQIDIIVKTLIKILKNKGAEVFIIPAMGSHGGATVQGQNEILAHYKITEELMGAKILSSMEVEKIGENKGVPIYISKDALNLDGIILLNRIKPHTDLIGDIESGLQKMLAIGLGKQKGAEECHKLGLANAVERIKAVSEFALNKMNILFGVGLIENAYEHTAEIVCLTKDEILKEEPFYLKKAKSLMPMILFDYVDILVVNEIGKDISGDGMDPNIIGRNFIGNKVEFPKIQKIVVLDLTKNTDGNAVGIGLSDFTTRKVYDKIIFENTYPNVITAKAEMGVKIPMVLDTNELAVKAAIKMLNKDKVSIVRITNTLHLKHIMVTKSLLDKAKGEIQIIEGPIEPTF